MDPSFPRKPWRFYTRLGNCHAFLVPPQGDALVFVGPHCEHYAGLYFLVMFCVIGAIGSIFAFKLAPRSSVGLQVCGLLIVGLTLLAYAVTALKNPGIPQMGENELPLLARPYCTECRSYQAQGTVHCPSCRVCIRNRDHHCPWVGKCVGEGNQLSFNCFLLGIVASIFYILLCSSLINKAQP